MMKERSFIRSRKYSFYQFDWNFLECALLDFPDVFVIVCLDLLGNQKMILSIAFLFIAFINHINRKCYRHNQYTVAIKALKNSFQSNVYCHLQEVNASEIVSP